MKSRHAVYKFLDLPKSRGEICEIFQRNVSGNINALNRTNAKY